MKFKIYESDAFYKNRIINENPPWKELFFSNYFELSLEKINKI